MVSDNGIGFNETYKEDIFKIFHRLHTSQFQGTGIGLAICKKIMELHDGFIEVSSEEGKGANFALYFPVSPWKNAIFNLILQLYLYLPLLKYPL